MSASTATSISRRCVRAASCSSPATPFATASPLVCLPFFCFAAAAAAGSLSLYTLRIRARSVAEAMCASSNGTDVACTCASRCCATASAETGAAGVEIFSAMRSVVELVMPKAEKEAAIWVELLVSGWREVVRGCRVRCCLGSG